MSKNENKKEEGTKKSNSLSTTKLLAAALAAITASLITTRLTSYIGSVLIVGITSILIAVFSEFYTRVIKKTKRFGAKIAYNAVPYDKVLPTSIAERIDEKLIDVMSTTTTMPSITPLDSPQNASHDEHDTLYQSDKNGAQKADSVASKVHIAQIPIANDDLAQLVKSMNEASTVKPIKPVLTDGSTIVSKNDSNDSASKNDSNIVSNNDSNVSSSSNDVDIEQERSEETISETIDNDDNVSVNDSSDDNDKSGILSRLKSFFNFHIESNITKGVLLFLAIAMITSAMSWAITTYVDKPSVTNVTNVTEQRVQRLSDDEKNEIKQQVKSEVSSQIAQAQNDASNASNSAEDISKQIESIESRLTTLESEQKQQSSSSDNTQSSPSNQSNSNNTNSNNSNVSSADINNLKNQIASLKSQLAMLQSRVNQLESNQSSNTQNNNIDSEKSGQ